MFAPAQKNSLTDGTKGRQITSNVSNLPQITHSAKETRQQKEPWGRLGDWGGEFCEQSLNKGGGVHKIGG